MPVNSGFENEPFYRAQLHNSDCWSFLNAFAAFREKGKQWVDGHFPLLHFAFALLHNFQ